MSSAVEMTGASLSGERIVAHCHACGHEWVVAYLPMPLDKAARLMRGAACPKCADEHPRLA